MIAMGLSCHPKMVIADEPTTAVDVTTQAQLLQVMTDMVEYYKTSLIIVTHNLGVVARHVHRIYVMYAGQIVESGTAKEIFGNPCHPYTIGLLHSIPRLDEPKRQKLTPIPGTPPDLIDIPPVCAFRPRCEYRQQCRSENFIELRLVSGQHYVRCPVSIRGAAN
jgi:oligopeptide/dipeptide ABC transporter ATP-binding protein